MLEKPGIQASQSLTDGTKFKSKEEHQLGYLTTCRYKAKEPIQQPTIKETIAVADAVKL